MVSESFTPSPSEIGAARHFALAAAEHLGCCPADLGLVVSELATNACVHARSPFSVTVQRHDAGLLVEVADDDPGPGRACNPSPMVHLAAACTSWPPWQRTGA